MDHIVFHISSVVHVEDVGAVCLDKSHAKRQCPDRIRGNGSERWTYRAQDWGRFEHFVR